MVSTKQMGFTSNAFDFLYIAKNKVALFKHERWNKNAYKY